MAKADIYKHCLQMDGPNRIYEYKKDYFFSIFRHVHVSHGISYG